MKMAKAILRQKCGVENTRTRDLRPSDFTKHIAVNAENPFCPDIQAFSIPRNLQREVKKAILRSSKNKATGVDGIFYEALQVCPADCAKILCAFWQKCGDMKYRLKAWSQVVLCPVYKKGRKSDPSSYRPIALLSHARQVIARALTRLIQKEYRNHWTQLGFTELTGCETAIIRHIANARAGARFAAILDLKSAYNSVPRQILMQLITHKLPAGLAAMLSLLLQPEQIRTKGDPDNVTYLVGTGVPQGCAASPIVFNLYMDTLPELMTSALRGRSPSLMNSVHISMFADDVKIQATSAQALQVALNICTQWASVYKMTWNTKKCHILAPPSAASQNYELCGSVIAQKQNAVYLGVSISYLSTTSHRSIERVISATRRIDMLRQSGLSRQQVPSATLIALCRTFVYPTAEYCAHLVPNSTAPANMLAEQLELLDYKVVEYCLGCVPIRPQTAPSAQRPRIGRRLPRMLKLAKLPDWKQKIQLRLESLKERIQTRSDLFPMELQSKQDISRCASAFRDLKSPRPLEHKDIIYYWKRLCVGKTRVIPTPETCGVPILKERERELREAGIKWYMGSFPGSSENLQMENSEKERIINYLRTHMNKPILSEQEFRKTRECLGALLAAHRQGQERS